jgi:hypothetical protein
MESASEDGLSPELPSEFLCVEVASVDLEAPAA